MALEIKDFIYSVYLSKEDAAQSFQLKFGMSGDSYYLFDLDIGERTVSFGDHRTASIKEADYPFVGYREYRVDLVVNDGVAKAFLDDDDVALLTFHLDGYSAGQISDNLAENTLLYSGRSLMSLNTLSGNIFCGGYPVEKVVNLTDGNYRLGEGEYTIDNGTIRIAEGYLNTLESATAYKFRAVTSLTDLDFYVSTKEVGASVDSLVAKYYRGDDAKFELSMQTMVKKAMIDQTEFAFVQDGTTVTIGQADLASLTSGEHTLKLYTEAGRPEAKFSIYETVETYPEIPAPVNHAYFFIDVAIFAALIVGYVVFSQIKKRGNRKV